MNDIEPYSIKKMGRPARAVNQYDLKGKYIYTYPSALEAYNYTGVSRASIINCCMGRAKRGGEYMWRYADEK